MTASLFHQTTSNQGQISAMKLGGKWFISIVIPSLGIPVSMMQKDRSSKPHSARRASLSGSAWVEVLFLTAWRRRGQGMENRQCRVVVPGSGWDCSRARAGAGRPRERVSSLPGTERFAEGCVRVFYLCSS